MNGFKPWWFLVPIVFLSLGLLWQTQSHTSASTSSRTSASTSVLQKNLQPPQKIITNPQATVGSTETSTAESTPAKTTPLIAQTKSPNTTNNPFIPENQNPCQTIPSGVVEPTPALPKGISGRVGLFVGRWTKNTNFETPERMVFKNPEWQFPLASNYKQTVLYEVFRQLQAGTLKINEKFDVTPANESLGWYPYDGTNVLGLAQRMMLLSDNTATDILHRRIGIGSLQPLANKLALCKTRLILPTKLWWTAEAGFGGTDFPRYGLLNASRKFASANLEEQINIAKRLDMVAQKVKVDQLNPALETFFSGRNGDRKTMAEIDRNLQNASTPIEWARLLHYFYNNTVFIPKLDKLYRQTAWLGKGRAFLRVPFSNYAGKSGNTARVLTFSGAFSALSGDRIIYVYFNDASQTETTRDQTKEAFDYINAGLRTVMRQEDLIWPKKIAPTISKNNSLKNNKPKNNLEPQKTNGTP